MPVFNLGLFGQELVELFMFEVEFTSKIPESQGNWEIRQLFA